MHDSLRKIEETDQSSYPPQINFSEFRHRWRQARQAALHESLESTPLGFQPEQETQLVLTLPENQKAALLKRVYDYGRKLGRSAVSHYQLAWDAEDFIALLGSPDFPCFQGDWQKRSQTIELERKGCTTSCAGAKTSFLCDYWREAADGVAVGVLYDMRFTRYKSQGHGDSHCLDVLYPSFDRSLHWGPLPEGVLEKLKEVEERILSRHLKARLRLFGHSEGTVFYMIESSEGPLCGAAGKIVQHRFESAAQKEFPFLRFKECSPSAVIKEE